ncbi:glycine-rich domain-containing protein [Amycolatopsis azurea]|uniref:glycine-rich domain-containing protein n=1 Tax=Amycolatopsis azurea TaxID=36819 RepID=UPI0037F9FC62
MANVVQARSLTTGRSLVPEWLFDRLVRAVQKAHAHDYATAVRIMDQALAFLGACARFPERSFAPSILVDHGWHTFILYTEHYRGFCERVAGRFIDHIPDDDPTDIAVPDDLLSLTVDAIEEAGFSVDRELWDRTGDCQNKCNGRCHHCGTSTGGR